MYSVYRMIWLHHVADFIMSAIVLVHKLSSYKVVSSITTIKIIIYPPVQVCWLPFSSAGVD